MLRSLIIWTGGGALLTATAIDTVSVIGRNIGMPVLGSIELVQAAILVSGVIALVLATIDRSHARVQLVSASLTGLSRHVITRFGRLADVVLFALLLAGSVWLAADLWYGHERSELLGIPWSVLRLIANAALVACLGISLARLLRAERS
ncbi:TRAP transporter small permease [Tsuneonella sp. HG222]